LFQVGSAGNLQLLGSESVEGTPTFVAGSSVTYTGTSGPYTIKDWDYQNLVFNGSVGTFNLGANETVAGNLTLTAAL